MLTPDELTTIVESMYPHIDELNDWIVKNIIKSIMARLNRGEALSISETNKWQMTVLQTTGHHFDDLQAEIQNFTRRSQKEIQQIFEDAGIRSWESDEDFYQLQGFEPRPLIANKRILEILEDSYKRTNGEIRNLTRTTALMSQRNLETILDKAHMKVITGAQSYSAAFREAINELTGYQAEVSYPTGHKDTVETAVMRCIRTGTAQASGNMALENMIQHDWDLIRVSAHLGARYGDSGENPGNHFWWQGKLYSRTGKDKKYPDFVTTTGYGTGEGLSGWNCRHSFGPGDPDHNPFKDYDAEENKRVYDLSQKQRAAERKIRHQKTKVLGLHEAMNNASSEEEHVRLEELYQKEALRLQKYNGEYNKLCEDNGLKKLSERITVQKWNRSEAARATQSANKLANESKIYYNTDNKQDAIYQFLRDDKTRNWIKSDKFNKTIHQGKQDKHIKGTNNYIKGRSYVTVPTSDLQGLVDKYAGTGKLERKSDGRFNSKELCKADRQIGVAVTDNGEYPTSWFKIHYSKNGTHIVPIREIE